MGLFEKIFGSNKQKLKAESAFKMLNGYTPVFRTWDGSIYESDLVRASIDARARHISKLQPIIKGSAQKELQRALKKNPNGFQTWSQFLYRTSTILDAKNTAFVVPILDKYLNTTGIYTICPNGWELVESGGKPWIRFSFDNGKTNAIELERVGILTKYQYKSDFFGEPNTALRSTMELIDIQKQGIEEYAKNANSYRFMAKYVDYSFGEDLAKERKRFDDYNFKNGGGGGILLFPNTYTDIKQITAQAYAVDPEQTKTIQQNVYSYFGVNEEVLQNKAYGDAFSAFYEGSIEPFAIQLSEVLTRMLFTLREQTTNEIIFTANRLQYMSTGDKLNFSVQMIDRGMLTINEARTIWNLAAIDGGDVRIIRGEYYDADTKLVDEGENTENGNQE